MAGNPKTDYKPKYQLWSEEEFSADPCVRAMSPSQRWMYRTLLQAAFFCSSRPYLPDNDAFLWMLAGCENREQWEENKKPVKGMFTKTKIDERKYLARKRLVSDWEQLLKRRETMAEIGKLGGEAKAKRAVSVRLPAAAKLSEVKLSEVEKSESEVISEETMSLKTRITDTCRKVLHVRLRPEDNQWPEVTSLARVHGPDAVLEAFESWAESKRGEDLTYPLSKFVEKADGIIGGEISLKTDDRLQPLILKLVNSCDGVVDFEQKQVLAIGKLLCDNTPEEIEAAFREFFRKYENDQFNLNGRKFVETAPQYLSLLKHRKTEATRQARILEMAKIQSQSEAIVQKMDEAEEAVEDRLGD